MIELYFSELESKMAGLPKPARQEFLQELRAHVHDRLQQTTEPTAKPIEDQCRAVLAALGAPEEIARHYLIEAALSRARRSNSPLLLLRSTLRWALTGMQGFAVFMAALVGYMTALGFYVLAILKPIFPHNVGLYAGSFGFNNIVDQVLDHPIRETEAENLTHLRCATATPSRTGIIVVKKSGAA